MESLSHTHWECQFHIVFVPKYRKKTLYPNVKEFLKRVFHELAKQRGSTIISGYLMIDHVHMLIKIPPKYSVSEVVGYLKGKSAIAIARQFGGKKRNFSGESFWARGYFVSTVGLEKKEVLNYIKNQEAAERKMDGLF